MHLFLWSVLNAPRTLTTLNCTSTSGKASAIHESARSVGGQTDSPTTFTQTHTLYRKCTTSLKPAHWQSINPSNITALFWKKEQDSVFHTRQQCARVGVVYLELGAQPACGGWARRGAAKTVLPWQPVGPLSQEPSTKNGIIL